MICRRLAVACLVLFVSRGGTVAEEIKGRSVRVAAVSFVPGKFDLSKNVVQLEKMFREAAAGGADIAVAPEGILEGYVVNEIIAGKAEAEAMKQVAVSIDSPTIPATT